MHVFYYLNEAPVRDNDYFIYSMSLGARGSLSTMSDGYLNEAPVRDHDYFIGDMQQFIYNGNHFFDMANKDNIENIDVTARFVFFFLGPTSTRSCKC